MQQEESLRFLIGIKNSYSDICLLMKEQEIINSTYLNYPPQWKGFKHDVLDKYDTRLLAELKRKMIQL